MKNGKFTTHYMAKIGALLALSIGLMFIEFPLPLLPPFLKMDFSEVPILFAGFAMGPVAVVILEVLKNVLHFFLKNDGTGGVGNLANFLVGIALAVPAALYYMKHKNRKSALIGLIIGTVTMVVVACLANYFILLPLYGMTGQAERIGFITAAAIPFNAIKAVLSSAVVYFTYKAFTKILHW